MANSLSTLTWVVDTPSTSVLKFGKIYIVGLHFNGYTTGASDSCTIQDGRIARTIYTIVGRADKTSVDLVFGGGPAVLDDIIVNTLTSGQLTIDLASRG